MLRSLVLLLLVANLAFYAWTQGWLGTVVGVQSDAQHEPQRLKLQVNASQITVLPPERRQAASEAATAAPAEATPAVASAADNGIATAPSAAPGGAAASNAASASAADNTAPSAIATICLEAGPFTAAEVPGAKAALQPLVPAGTWSMQTVGIQGLWLVYMGPFANAEALARKQAELQRIRGLTFDEVHTPANLALGLSLGRFTQLADAEASLAALRNRGIRTARIVTVRPPAEVQIARVPAATERMQVALAGAKLPQGKGFTACRP
jgi:hypothetical protein